MLFFILFVLFGYALLIIRLMKGLKNADSFQKNNEQLTASIIVAAKNEAHAINDCIAALIAQDYPQAKLEIIVVDDASNDNTFTILKNYAQQHQQIKILSTNNYSINNSEGTAASSSKKQALTSGIQAATGEVLLFTDADCVPSVKWVAQMISCFQENIGVVIGFSPVIDRQHTRLGKLIEFDSMVAASIAAAGCGLNFPITCTGRNFAYRTCVFEQVQGYRDLDHSVSGDDDLFLHQVRKKTDWSICYNLAPGSFVPSFQTKSFAQLLIQKRRHLSAAKYYPIKLQFAYMFAHGTNYGVWLFFLISCYLRELLFAAIVFLVFKFVLDYAFIKTGAIELNRKAGLIKFIGWELFSLSYHLISGPWAMIGKIKWK